MGTRALTRVNPAAWGRGDVGTAGWARVARLPRSARTQGSRGAARGCLGFPASPTGAGPVGSASSHPQRGLVPWAGGSPSLPPPGFANANKRQAALPVGGVTSEGPRGSCADSADGQNPPAQASCPGSALARVPKSAQIGELPNYACFSLSLEQPILSRSFLLSTTVPVSRPGVAGQWGWGGRRSALGTLPPGDAEAGPELRAVRLAGALPWPEAREFFFVLFLSEVCFYSPAC